MCRRQITVIENAETSEEVKEQKSEESLSENNKPDEAEKRTKRG